MLLQVLENIGLWIFICWILFAIVIMFTSEPAFFKGSILIISAVAVMFVYANGVGKKAEKERQAEYVAEMAWKEPIINNCENAVRRISDAQTVSIGSMFGGRSLHVNKTDSGYLYAVQASDATTANKTVTILCYTDRNGQVVRVVPQSRY